MLKVGMEHEVHLLIISLIMSKFILSENTIVADDGSINLLSSQECHSSSNLFLYNL